MAAILLKISTLLYLVAAVSYLAYLLAPKPRLAKAATGVLCAALVVHVVTIVDRWIELEVTPVTNFREALSFFALALAGIYLALQIRFDRPVLGAFVMPLAAVAMFSAVLLPHGGTQVPDTLRSTWLPIHISMAFLGDAAFAVAAAVASAYLIMESKMKRKTFGGVFGRLPSLESLDDLNYNLVRFGFVLLSMAILTGTLWAGQLWESYFSWEPRQLSAMVAWMLYAGLIVSRWLAGWRGRRAAVITLVGFVVMVGSFVTLKVFDLGRHGGTYV
jgi:cytochrome c-type biogenesis protein CcsB